MSENTSTKEARILYLRKEIHSTRNAMWNAFRQGRNVSQHTSDELRGMETELSNLEAKCN